jgi:hypothetical protein
MEGVAPSIAGWREYLLPYFVMWCEIVDYY